MCDVKRHKTTLAKGREEILKIHTRRMAASGHLASNVDLGALARDNTDSFTGAELEAGPIVYSRRRPYDNAPQIRLFFD